MRIVKATQEFNIKGNPYKDFPLIFDSKMNLVIPIYQFLINQCINNKLSKNTWSNYSQSLYDYFGYLESNNLSWKNYMASDDYSIIASYRDWSLKASGLRASTINGRLRVIINFYKYALSRKWIKELPFEIRAVKVYKKIDMLSHINKSIVETNNMLLRKNKKTIKILSMEECNNLINKSKSITHKLIFSTALQTGLRKSELLTFPVSYIKQPSQDNYKSGFVNILLNPEDMKIKYTKERVVRFPISLYVKLWNYKIHSRNLLINNETQNTIQALFVTSDGGSYQLSNTSLNKQIKKATGNDGTHIHTLRHTYATYTLYELEKSGKPTINSLMYIQESLGHESLQTTAEYLHVLHQLDDDLVTEYQDNINKLF